jgi:hypothetical protein
MPPLPTKVKESNRADRFFILSFDRYRGSLFVVSPEEISLVESYYALPGQTLEAYLRTMESKVFEVLRCVHPTLYLAARQNLRDRFESISRIPVQRNASLDRSFGPHEKYVLHRLMLSMIRRKVIGVEREKYRVRG